MANDTLNRAVAQCLLAMGGGTLLAGAALAEHTPEHLGKVQVTGSPLDFSFTNPSADEAKETLRKVPGATTLIKAEDFNNRANTGGLADVLSRIPGVFAESRFGNQESRLSIRGSGLMMTFGTMGVRYLRDGLPLINADGFGSPELFEPMTAEHIEVYRGANALQYGSSTLGGAVNIVSKTGRNYNGYGVSMVYGTHDYMRPQAQAGGLITENLDYYATYTGSFTDGFREHSREDIHRFFGNMGYRWDERNETRFYLMVSQNRLELPGSLPLFDLRNQTFRFKNFAGNVGGPITFTQPGFQTDPRSANIGSNLLSQNSRNFDIIRGDLKHTMLLGDGDKLDFGGWYEFKRFDHPTPDPMNQRYDNAGGSFRYLKHDQLWGHNNHLTVGGFLAWGDVNGDRTCRITAFECSNTPGFSRHRLSTKSVTESWTVEGYAEDRFELNDKFDLVAGMQGTWAKRERFENLIATAASGVLGPGVGPHVEQAQNTFGGVSPKFGAIWKAFEGGEVYSNVSRSYQPPSNGEFAPFTLDAAGRGQIVKTKGQDATTIELGVRGEKGIFSWDVAAYHSWVNNELLTQQNPLQPAGTSTITTNAKSTTHSGVEAAAGVLIPLGVLGDDKLRLSAVYNYTRFIFQNNQKFSDHYLPGIPNHFGQAEALYEHPSGFYIGPNVKMANSYFVDFANTQTQKTPAFAIVGARAGYKSKDHWSVFVEGKNLTNDNWVSNVGLTGTATRNSAVYNPGYDRQVIGGVSIDFF